MRKQGLIFLVVLAGIVIAVYMIFSDRWLEKRMELLGNKIVGAKVEYDNVDFSLIGLRLQWGRLQVTDPDDTWKNLLETGRCSFDIALEPLFKKKFIIEGFAIQDMRFNTDRETDGKLPPRKEPPKKKKSKIAKKIEEKLENEKSQIPVLNPEELTGKIDVKSLWESIDLQTPGNIEDLKDSYIEKFEGWENRIAGLTIEKDIEEAKKQIESIRLDKIRSVEDIEDTIAVIDDIYNRAEYYKKTVQQMVEDFDDDMQELGQTDDLIKGWIKDDFEQVLELVQLPDVSKKNVAKILFGKKIIERIERVTRIIEKVRFYRAKLQRFVPEKKEKPPRFEGQDIQFVRERELPNFWIKTIELSGEMVDGTRIAGNVRDIVAGQKIIDSPTTFKVEGVRRDNALVRLEGILDYREDESKELFSLDMENLPLRDVRLTDFALLPNAISRGDAAIASHLNFTGPDFETGVEFLATEIAFDYSEKPTDLSSYLYDISRSITESITEIQFGAKASYIAGDFSFSIFSNLDDIIAERMKEIISDEIKKAREALEEMIEEEVEKYRKEFYEFVEEKEEEIRTEIEKYEAMVQGYLEEIDEKRKQVENILQFQKKKLQMMLEEELRKQKERAEEELRKQKEKLEEELRRQQQLLEEEKKRQQELLDEEKKRQQEELEKKAKEKIKKLF